MIKKHPRAPDSTVTSPTLWEGSMTVRVTGINRVRAVTHVLIKARWIFIPLIYLFGYRAVTDVVGWFCKKLIKVEPILVNEKGEEEIE